MWEYTDIAVAVAVAAAGGTLSQSLTHSRRLFMPSLQCNQELDAHGDYDYRSCRTLTALSPAFQRL